MKRHVLNAVALLSALLAGCTVNYHQQQPIPPCGACTSNSKADPMRPQVLVSNGQISVDQDVLRFTKAQTNITITWTLPEGFSFPANGIVFERAAAKEIVDCKPGRSPREFTCRNVHARPGVYRYGINANEGDIPLKPLDPFVMND